MATSVESSRGSRTFYDNLDTISGKSSYWYGGRFRISNTQTQPSTRFTAYKIRHLSNRKRRISTFSGTPNSSTSKARLTVGQGSTESPFTMRLTRWRTFPGSDSRAAWTSGSIQSRKCPACFTIVLGRHSSQAPWISRVLPASA